MNTRRDIYTRLLYARKSKIWGRAAYLLLKFLGVEVPRAVELGEDVLLVHGAFGTVVHPRTRIGDNVKIYPGVTLGRADVHLSAEQSGFEGIVIEDGVILSPGVKVLCNKGILHVRRGTIIGANAVLLQSTGEGEMWAGLPANRVGMRDGWPSEGAA